MPHMLAEEHLGYFVIDPALARNHTTIQGALSNIGSTPKTLVLTFSGDGVWTIGANLTIPANVTLCIPPGVTVHRPAGVTLTVHGPILAWQSAWETGPGTTVRGMAARTEISALRSTDLSLLAPLGDPSLTIGSPGLIPTMQFFNQGGPNASPGISFLLDPGTPNSNWVLGNNANQNAIFFISHASDNPHFALSHVGCWIGNGTLTPPTPLHLLHLQLDDAFKPGDGTWDFPSDQRLKTVVRLFADGLAKLRALPDPVVYTWNGKAQTPVDGREYIGMIGQEVQAVAPYMIHSYQSKLEDSDPEPTEILSMNDSALTYILINAVRELATRVEALETSLAARHGSERASAPDSERRTMPRKRAS